jgi:ATP-dependent Clp protease ATP-binding subunit ClpX
VPPQGGRKHPQQEYIRVDTSGILFICGGAFVGLEKSSSAAWATGDGLRRGGARPRTSGDVNRDKVLQFVEPEDLIAFGFIPEFVGRLPMTTVLEELTEEQLVSILTDTKNALTKQYSKLLAMEGVELEFTPDALRELAAQAIKKGTGARALRSLLEKIMLDVMYDVPRQRRHCRRDRHPPRRAGRAKPLLRRKTDQAAA